MGRFVYEIYRIAVYLLIPVLVAYYALKMIRAPVYRNRISERFGILPDRIQRSTIWIHAVSVGEVNAAVPLIRKLLDSTDKMITVSCTTPTGSDQIQKLDHPRVQHIYAPLDLGFVIRSYLTQLQPVALIIMETELWPNLIRHCRNRNIPIFFANMRISDHSYHNACRMRPFYRYVIAGVDGFCVQTAEDKNRIVTLGADTSRVVVTGNLKFDVDISDDFERKGQNLSALWGGTDRQTIILGSSHEGEEAMMIEVYRTLKKDFSELACVIVPRHPERFDLVYSMLQATEFSVVKRSQLSQNYLSAADVILGDTMGELVYMYAASDIAIMGGSFVPVGGHNILEVILAKRPVLFGPHMFNFREIANHALSANAGRQVQNASELAAEITACLSDSNLCSKLVANGQEFLSANKGAVDLTFESLRPALRH